MIQTRAVVTLASVILAVTLAVSKLAARELSFEDRVVAQRAIETVYWSHRIWPTENPTPKPGLAQVMSDETLRAKVENYLRESNALETWWRRPITHDQLQAEMDRMASHSRDPQVLNELFAALGNDPFVIAETLARQSLADRLIRNWYASDSRFHADVRARAEAALAACKSVDGMRSLGYYVEATQKLSEMDSGWRTRGTRELGALEETSEAFVVSAILLRTRDEVAVASLAWPKQPFDVWWAVAGPSEPSRVPSLAGSFSPPAINTGGCADDTWTPTSANVDRRAQHTAVWTGSEMIVWGGISDLTIYLSTGGRYNPATDSWVATSNGANLPDPRAFHTAVWTGTDMIVWGGHNYDGTEHSLDSGSRYNPATDAWTPTPQGVNAPSPRYRHTAVWTGTEMIVWGGFHNDLAGFHFYNSGGRYNPATNAWAVTSMGADVPMGREYHSAVWTGSKMIVWGGYFSQPDGSFFYVNSGGRYDPSTDTWTPTSVGVNVPSVRREHVAVWAGSEMIVWGGQFYDTQNHALNTGARYNPATNSWTPTSMASAPIPRELGNTAVWTGDEMIVWGGYVSGVGWLNSGGRYTPSSDTWAPTSAGANVPSARHQHTAVWTGTEMIIWGGASPRVLNSGGRYSPATNSWVPTFAGSSSVPTDRYNHTAVWTGAEMIVCGGFDGVSYVSLGGRYDAATDSWSPLSGGANAPSPRFSHTAVWTGTEMIVWGGYFGGVGLTGGGRYDPSSDNWLPIAQGGNEPAARYNHTAVWTGTQMIVWGGEPFTDTGGRYTPASNGWLPTSIGANVPSARTSHSAVWTGSEMIVWGGSTPALTNTETGGAYNPVADSWRSTSTAGSPSARRDHVAVWSGSEMIVWGGRLTDGSSPKTGARYSPGPDTWAPTSTGLGTPAGRYQHRAVWTGTEMVLWGGSDPQYRNTGGRYRPATDSWKPTSVGVNAPGPRTFHTAVWTGKEMIVWGGQPPQSSGGRYCVCPDGRRVYRDADGDGYGDPAIIAISNCDGTLPAGYVDDGTDCDDTNLAVHPGVPEINDGLDDQWCPGEPGYGEVDEISGASGFFTAGDDSRFSWPPQGGATAYEVVRSSTGNFSADCVVFTSSDAFIVDTELPAVGTSFHYLVRPSSPHAGSWGRKSDGSPRSGGCLSP